MSKQAKVGLYYQTWEGEVGQYKKTYVYAFSADRETIESKIAGCVDNAAGYGSEAMAKACLQEFSAMRAAGVEYVIEGHMYGQKIRCDFQHYRTRGDGTLDYCDAHFEFGNEYGQATQSIRLVERIAKQATKLAKRDRPLPPRDLTPETTIAALQAMGAKCVEESGVHMILRKGA